MKVLQAGSVEETHAAWTGTIKRLIHRYLERRNKRCAVRRNRAENQIVAPYKGRRWCDETERELIRHIMNVHGSQL